MKLFNPQALQTQSFVVKALERHNPGQHRGEEPDILAPLFGRFVRPRFDPAEWQQHMERSTRLKSALEEIATASVGLGVYGVPDPMELEVLGDKPAKNRRKALLDSARAITTFCQSPKRGSYLPLAWELQKAEIDFLSSGNGYIEVIEENYEAGNNVIGLSHIRAPYMRVNPTRTQWVQGVQYSLYGSGRDTSDLPVAVHSNYYRVYGDADPSRRFINRKTGEFFDSWPSELDESLKGTAVLHAASYNPLDPYYGMPVQVPALYAIMENEAIAKFMVGFMESGTQVPLLIIVEGGNLTSDSMEKIEVLFNSDTKGLDSNGRAAVIQPTIHGLIGQQAKIRVERVELGVKDFAPLLGRKSVNDGEILESTRMSGVFIGGGEGAQATTRNAAVLKQLSFEHAIEPRAAFWEALLNNGVAPKISVGGHFHCRRPKNLDPLQVASLMQKMKDGLTINDMRQAVKTLVQGVDMPTINLGEYGDVPMGILAEKLKADLSEEVSPPENAGPGAKATLRVV